MLNLLRIVFILAFVQVSVRCNPIPEITDGQEDAFVIVGEKDDLKTSSSSDVVVPDGDAENAALSPENMLSDAAIASLLQVLQKSLLMSLSSPPEMFGGFTRMGFPPKSGEVTETFVAPGSRLRVIHRTYAPPSLTTVASGKVDGKNVNKMTQNQMYATQNLSVLQKGTDKRKGELIPDIVDVETTDTEGIPKDVLNDLKVLDTIKNELEKLNSVFE